MSRPHPHPALQMYLALVVHACLAPSVGDSLCLGLTSPHATVPTPCLQTTCALHAAPHLHVFRPHLGRPRLSPTTHCVPRVSPHVPVTPCWPSAAMPPCPRPTAVPSSPAHRPCPVAPHHVVSSCPSTSRLHHSLPFGRQPIFINTSSHWRPRLTDLHNRPTETVHQPSPGGSDLDLPMRPTPFRSFGGWTRTVALTTIHAPTHIIRSGPKLIVRPVWGSLSVIIIGPKLAPSPLVPIGH